MAENESETHRLRLQIEAAFSGQDCPDEGSIVACTLQHLQECLECQETLAAFTGKDWRGLELEFLFWHHAAMRFMTPEAFRYYLPAYMCAAAFQYVEADIISDCVFGSLARPLAPSYLEFTPEQRSAVIAFLEYMGKEYGADDPLGEIDRAKENVMASGPVG